MLSERGSNNSFTFGRKLKATALTLGMTFAGLSSAFVAPSAQADMIRYLPTGRVAISQWYVDLKSAQKSIDMTYFIFNPCDIVGKMVIKTLAEKASQGVKVRLLLDGTVTPVKDWPLLTGLLQNRNIELRLFNKYQFNEKKGLTYRNLQSNYRSHAKLTLVDDEKYITGGRNIQDDYFSLHPDFNFVDRDAHVQGQSAAAAKKYFDELWESGKTFVPPVGSPDVVAAYEAKCTQETEKDKAVAQFLEMNAADVVRQEPVISCDDVTYVQDNPEFRHATPDYISRARGETWLSGERLKLKRTSSAVLNLINSTKRELLMENWAYVPSGDVEKSILAVQRRGAKAYTWTNTISDVTEMRVVQRYFMDRDEGPSHEFRRISRYGSNTDRWELTPAKTEFMLHSKVWVADRKDIIISSFNIDPRSYHTNLETGVIVKNCPALVAEAMKGMSKLTEVSKADATCKKCHEFPTVSFKDRVRSWLAKEYL